MSFPLGWCAFERVPQRVGCTWELVIIEVIIGKPFDPIPITLKGSNYINSLMVVGVLGVEVELLSNFL